MNFKWPSKEGISPNYSRKISEVLLEFAHEIAPPDSAPHVLELAVGLAVILWNLPLLPEEDQAEGMNHLRQWLAQRGGLHLQTEMVRLLELRRTRYGSDRRFVVDHKLEHNAKGPRLIVASLDAERPENRKETK